MNLSIRNTFHKKENINYSYKPIDDPLIRQGKRKIFNFTDIQKQILYGGMLGDGNLKKQHIGESVLYRESHACTETEYVLWKYEQLYECTTKHLYYTKKRRENQNPQVGFYTVSTRSLIPFYKMTRMEVIEKLEDLGFIIWLLDDGHCRKDCKKGRLTVSMGMLTKEEQKLILQKTEELGLVGCHLIGRIEQREMSIPSCNNAKIKEMTYKYFDKNIDVIEKKINYLS